MAAWTCYCFLADCESRCYQLASNIENGGTQSRSSASSSVPRKHDFVRLVGISGLPEVLCIFDGYHADDVESCEISWAHDNVVRSVAVGLGQGVHGQVPTHHRCSTPQPRDFE